MRDGILFVELVEWRSGQVELVAPSVREPVSTGSTLLNANLYAMRGPSNPRTTTIMTKACFLFPLQQHGGWSGFCFSKFYDIVSTYLSLLLGDN